MARDANIKAVMTVNDQASGPIKNFQNNLMGVKQSLDSVNSAADALSGGLMGFAVGAGIGAVADLGIQLAKDTWELGKLGAQSQRTQDSFEKMAEKAGISGTAMLDAMRTASRGTVSDSELMMDANRAMVLGVADSAQEMSRLVEAAIVRGRDVGVGASQAVSDLITGIGRMSPEILDNLDIANAKGAFDSYAASLGTTADKLTDVQKKQALVNSVLQSTQGAQVAEDAMSKFERLDVAMTNAKEKWGQLLAPAMAGAADLAAGTASILTNAIEADTAELDRKINDLQEKAANWRGVYADSLGGGEGNRGAQNQVEAFTMLANAVKLANGAMANGIPEAKSWASTLNVVAEQATRTGQVSNENAVVMSTLMSIMNQAGVSTASLSAATQDSTGSAIQHTAALEAVRAKLAELAGQADVTGNALRSAWVNAAGALGAGQALAGFQQSQQQLAALQQEWQHMGLTSEQIQFKTSEFLSDTNDKIQTQSDLAVGYMSQIDGITAGLVGNLGADAALAKGEELKAQYQQQLESLRAQGYTDEEIRVLMQANVAETQKWASGLDKVKAGASSIQSGFDNLLGKVQGELSQALNIGDVFKPEDILPREDAVNENARRLADIAKNGLKGQDWLGEFQKEAPAAWADLMLKQAGGQDIRQAAARMLQDFQDGLRPELIDMSAIKEHIKTQIAGEGVLKAQAAQITAELVADTGGDSADIAAKVNKALGLGVKGVDPTSGIVSMFQSSTFQAQLTGAATTSGQNWGNQFLAIVEKNVPTALVGVLASLVTPEVLATINAQKTQTGPTP